MKYINILFLFIFCTSCHDTNNISINSFDVIESVVEYDSLFSDKEELMGSITDMEIIGNTLIVKHLLDEYQFSFIDVRNGKLICRWGKIGNAPNEFIDFGSNFTISDSKLVFLCNAKKEMNFVSLSDIIQKNDTINIESKSYPYTADFRPTDINIIDKNRIAIGFFKQGRFGMLDSMYCIKRTFGEYPFQYDEVNGIYNGMVFQSKLKSNINQSKFVILTLASDIFEIYQLSDTAISRSYVSPFQNIPKICKKGKYYDVDYKKSIAGLMKMAVSDERICFLYSSQNYDEARRNGKMSNEILSFNWKGEKIKKYILPFSINNFCINNDYIYCVRNGEEEMVIYRFRI